MSKLLKIISGEHAEKTGNPENKIPHFEYKKREKGITREESYKNRSYMQNKNLNKRGYG